LEEQIVIGLMLNKPSLVILDGERAQMIMKLHI